MVVTPDLYCGAYLLSKGAYLENILVNGQHKSRPTVLFVLAEIRCWSLNENSKAEELP